jgi:tellurium resistance protein TerD
MINLEKGQKVTINNGIKFAKVGLGWDVNGYDSGTDFDLDASIFMLGTGDKLIGDEGLIFYNNPVHPSGSVRYSGDNRTGEGQGDDEALFIDFAKVPSNVEKLAVVVTIHKATERKQNFGMVSNAYVRLLDTKAFGDTEGTEEIRFDLSEDYSTETALLVAEIYRHNGEWKFAAKGDGFNEGLEGFVRKFGGAC